MLYCLAVGVTYPVCRIAGWRKSQIRYHVLPDAPEKAVRLLNEYLAGNGVCKVPPNRPQITREYLMEKGLLPRWP